MPKVLVGIRHFLRWDADWQGGMKYGIRTRFALWLLVALLPAGLAAVYVFGQIEDQVSQRVADDLANVHQLEEARIESALDRYERDGRNLALDPNLLDFTADVGWSRETGEQTRLIGGIDGYAPIDAFAFRPLQQLADGLKKKANSNRGDVSALEIRGIDGSIYGRTAGFDWNPSDPEIIDRAVQTRSILIGDAFRDADGHDRLGLVVPIIGRSSAIVGVLILENDLAPVLDTLAAHHGFGQSSEAHVVQATPNGDAEFITPLRFEDDAEFNRVVAANLDLPVNESLIAPEEGKVLFAPDYRGADAIFAVGSIEGTNWGLIAKIDRGEALAPVLKQTRALKAVTSLGVLGVLIGWATLLDPIARRLRRMAAGAERVASGEYDSPLDDRSTDEIGSMGKSIDRLANDLATDIAVRADIEARLRFQATHDETTGLLNRQFATALMRRLSQPTDGKGGAFSLLFLDVDDFKVINDAYGHMIGDSVLVAAGGRLKTVVGADGSVARWGGDEFVLVLPDTDETGAIEVASRVERAFEIPIETNAGTHQIRVSVGSSTHRPGDSLVNLLHSADEAMFEEKQARSGRRVVSPESVRLVEHALENDLVEVWFQPLITAADSRLFLRGAEALVRLRDADGGTIAPRNFLKDVQRSHLGRALDRRVIERSLQQVSEWIKAGHLPEDFQLGVNCGEALMRDGGLAAFVRDCLEEYGLSGNNLMLEISENSSVLQPQIVRELGAMGVKFAIDDLGLHHSNVDRLVDGGASVAKIDRRWLQPDADAASLTVLRHLVMLCDALGYQIIAEGVETQRQLDLMHELGVTTFQGYLFSRPLSADDFSEKYLDAQDAAPESTATIRSPYERGSGEVVEFAEARARHRAL